METSNLTNTIATGIQNPECSFFVGAFMGQMLIFRLMILYFGLRVSYDLLEKLVKFLWNKRKLKGELGYW